VARLSQGERQRTALARALLFDPELLVLDEPLTHLDPGAVFGVLDVLKEAVRARGATVLLSSHQLEHVERSTDRLALMHRGRVRLEGSTAVLVAGAGTVVIRAEPRDAAARALALGPDVSEVKAPTADDGPDACFHVRTTLPAAELNARLHAAGCRVGYLAPARRSLDELFHEAIGASVEDAA
jgi:ABC-2 type transport system ATP-binding protein